MKNLFIWILVTLSIPTFGQIVLKASPDKSILKNLHDTKDNHLIILSAYRDQIDTEIKRLADGIELENSIKNEKRVLQLNEYFLSLLLKRIFISEIENQIKSADFNMVTLNKKPILNSETLKIDLVKEIGSHVDATLKNEHFPQHVLGTFKNNLIDEALKESAKRIYKSLGNGLLKKILTSGISNSALNSAVMSIASEAFMEAGVGTIVHVLTLPLHGYRSTPEQAWLDIIKKNPEIMINPEWMKHVGVEENPWYVHGYAMLRHTELMEKHITTLISNEERVFRETIKLIFNHSDHNTEKLIAAESKVDNTKVHQKNIIDQDLPYWAIQKK